MSYVNSLLAIQVLRMKLFDDRKIALGRRVPFWALDLFVNDFPPDIVAAMTSTLGGRISDMTWGQLHACWHMFRATKTSKSEPWAALQDNYSSDF